MPSVSNDFTGTGRAKVPFFGWVPTTYYFDYSGQRQRFDQVLLGVSQTIVQYYNEGIQYTIYGGGCDKNTVSGSLSTYALPPWSHWVENTTIGGVAVSHWEASLGIGTIDVWSQLSADGKNDVLKQFSSSILGINTQFDFDTITDSVNASSFDPAQFGCPPLVPPPHYTISGYVIDSTTGMGVSGASVHASSLARTTTTDSHGLYTFAGNDIVGHTNYPIAVSAAGYTSASIDVNVSTSSIVAGTSGDVYLSAVLPSGGFRIVLRWGAQPRDLDSHLLLSPNDGGCEVYYGRRNCGVSSGVRASLDQDRTTGYGPETVTIVNGTGGKGDLTHFVYIYAGPPTSFLGDANVKLYGSSGLLDQMTVPSSPSTTDFRYWSTWRLHVDGTFDKVNKVTRTKPTPV
jgi:hypothetical protein